MKAISSPGSLRTKKDPNAFARVVGALLGLTLLLIGMAVAGIWIASRTPALLFAGEEMLLLWCAVVAAIQYIYLVRQTSNHRDAAPSESVAASADESARSSAFAWIWQWVFLFFALVLVGKLACSSLQFSRPLAASPVNSLQMAAVVLLVMAGLLYFFTNYAWVVQKTLQASALNSLLHLCQIAYWACAAGSVVTFIFLSTQRDYSGFLGWFLIGLSLVLMAEPWLRFGIRFYLPASKRSLPAPVGESVLVDLVFGSGHAGKNLIAQFENLIGLKMEEIWAVQFLRDTLLAVIIVGSVLAWLSTCLTVVPLGSRGVAVSFGQYEASALAPGLHVSWPWPWGEIDLVETERVREISLGFDHDLAGPMLWTKPHFVGEQNLLVGDGESLLTVDVPIQYRVSSPVAFLKAATNPAAGLKSLAARKLIEVARSSDSFQIMTVNREQMAAELKAGLQAEIDRLGLGVEVIFVGLKDVHPPVDVAPAYEKVISAQEEKEASIDLAKVYQAHVIPDTQASAQRLVAEAGAAKTMRVDLATGEADRFVSLVDAGRDNLELFRERLRYDALDEGLLAPNKIIVGLNGAKLPASYLDLRSIKNPEVPLNLDPQAQPEPPPREPRKELPDL
ncbi:MAG TPA: protease modulator HflK [Candidatus Methylacidiphilales bacterium]